MPFHFVLPTTSAFSFSSSFSSDTHPSLPLNASTHRGVVRDALKKHKRLPPTSQISNLTTVISGLNAYIPFLLAVDDGINNKPLPGGDFLNITLKSAPAIEWRPTLSGDVVPGRERARVKISSLGYEISFILSTLGFSHVLTARSALQPLYLTNQEFMRAQDRANAITSATKSLLEAASVYDYLASRGENTIGTPPCPDVSASSARALASLALAEATLLAVLKDDPYPAAVAQDRNKNDKEWMFKAPDIPKVRAHLYARLCLAASEHAAQAASLLGSTASGKVNPGLLKYLDDLRRTSRARACRFFGIDAELGGQTADGIGWARAGLQELGVEIKDTKKGLSFSRFKKDLTEKREDRRVEKETAWGSDAGKLEETRILEMLDAKWGKINDTMNTRQIPPINSLLSKMPSGREIHSIKAYEPPVLDRDVLEGMRAPPEEVDAFENDLSSDDEIKGGPSAPIGAFPGTPGDYPRSASTAGNAYY
ncbi:hypothetical protein B0J13DRAFT_115286 [Dactylonectria estremocensis]|uniref:pH-response regulator protein palC n=1 Tax=Dactylonectria estremocensis TaxID=1079267 RepID=A0A9P9FE82_9HYPO|nr:hypothetical protein B0J13DRAFT_115286 [Dactylonectria estremocensis]